MLVLASLSFGSTKSKQNKKLVKKTQQKQVYFKNCKEARVAGYSRMRRGEAGYREKFDRDGDGIACE